MPSAGKVVQTGPKIQFGGLNDGLVRLAYQGARLGRDLTDHHRSCNGSDRDQRKASTKPAIFPPRNIHASLLCGRSRYVDTEK